MPTPGYIEIPTTKLPDILAKCPKVCPGRFFDPLPRVWYMRQNDSSRTICHQCYSFLPSSVKKDLVPYLSDHQVTSCDSEDVEECFTELDNGGYITFITTGYYEPEFDSYPRTRVANLVCSVDPTIPISDSNEYEVEDLYTDPDVDPPIDSISHNSRDFDIPENVEDVEDVEDDKLKLLDDYSKKEPKTGFVVSHYPIIGGNCILVPKPKLGTMYSIMIKINQGLLQALIGNNVPRPFLVSDHDHKPLEHTSIRSSQIIGVNRVMSYTNYVRSLNINEINLTIDGIDENLFKQKILFT